MDFDLFPFITPAIIIAADVIKGGRAVEYSDLILCIRKQCALSQEELAKELGVSFASVNRWERKRTRPSQMAIRSIEEFCKTHQINYTMNGGVTHAD